MKRHKIQKSQHTIKGEQKSKDLKLGSQLQDLLLIYSYQDSVVLVKKKIEK